MKRKLLSLVTILSILLSSFTAAAYKRPPAEGDSFNIVDGIGSFMDESVLSYIKTKNGVLTWSPQNAPGGKGGCIRFEASDSYGYTCFDIPNVPGETYEVSFYAKVDKGPVNFNIPMRYESQTYGRTAMSNGVLTSEWQKFSFSYYCDGYQNNASGITQEALRLPHLRSADLNKTAYYLDELVITPKGDVPYDWSKVAFGADSSASKDVYPADDGFATEVPVDSVTFSDTTGHWAENTVGLLATSGVVSGMGDGTYCPEANITRAEFITLAMNLMKLDPLPYKGAYKDVQATDWFAGDLQSAVSIGFIHPVMTAGDNFLPNQPITREEAAYILEKIATHRGATVKKEAVCFADAAYISAWSKSAVEKATQYGFIGGYPDGSFKPVNWISRAEAASMIYRLIENYSKMAVFVDGVNGADSNEGTENAPLKTVEAARDLVRPYLNTMRNHIFVYIKAVDKYFLQEPLTFTTEDSGENGYSVVYTSWGEKSPVLSAGREYSNFVLHDKDENIYKTYVGTGTLARQIYVNDIRATRAKNDESNEGYLSRNGVLKNPVKDNDNHTITCDNPELAELSNQTDIELVYCEEWTNPRMKVKSIAVNDEGKCVIQVTEKSWDVAHMGNSTCHPSNGPMWIENAYELINAEGEWYLNKNDGYLYYKPRKFENPETMVATVPTLPHCMLVVGDDTDNKIHNLTFDNLTFEGATWLFPSTEEAAYRDSQLNSLTGGSGSHYEGDGRITGGAEDSAVTVVDAAYVNIQNCTVKNVGGAGIGFREIYQHCDVIGNEIFNTAGGGINFGCASLEGANIEKFRKPTEFKYFRYDCNVLNNSIHDTGLDYRGVAGIGISWLKNSNVSYNEIYNTSYSGMHVGWGWGTYASTGSATVGLNLTHNYIHDTCKDFLCDSGGIYTLGATGGYEENRNQIANNYFENMRGTPTCIYPDEGSTFWEIQNNVVDTRELGLLTNRKYQDYQMEWLCIHQPTIRNCYIHDNYSTNGKYRLNSTWNNFTNAYVYPEADWGEEAQAIKDNAGLQGTYLTERFPDDIERLRVLNEKPIYAMRSGEQLTVDVVGYKRKLNEVKPAPTDLYWYSTNEDVATVDENGVITGVGSGRCNIHVQYLSRGVYIDTYIELVCDDLATDFKLSAEKFDVIKNAETNLGAVAVTTSGLEVPITDVTYTVANPEIASVNEQGIVKGLQIGETTIHAVFSMDGLTKEMDIPIHVISYSTDNTVNYLDTSKKMLAGDDFFEPKSWNLGATDAGEGVTVADPKAAYYTTPVNNQVISFDLVINNPNTWPSLTLGISNPNTDYITGDTYLIGIKPDIIELQRFNKNKRTMIFGDDSFKPIGGVGFPNLKDGTKLFEYGKRYSITTGWIEEENGTRIILLINDVPVFDYLDTDEGRVKGEGLFGVYAFSGNFQLLPYTAQKFTGGANPT